MSSAVFGFGDNYHGQLSPTIKEKSNVNEPVKLYHLGKHGREVKVLDARGKTCTIDQKSHLTINGIKETRFDPFDSQLEIMHGTSWICEGTHGNSNFAIDSDDILWSWGANGRGQLGHGDKADREKPKKIEALADERIKEVSVGGYWGLSACVTIDNTCFVWVNVICSVQRWHRAGSLSKRTGMGPLRSGRHPPSCSTQ